MSTIVTKEELVRDGTLMTPDGTIEVDLRTHDSEVWVTVKGPDKRVEQMVSVILGADVTLHPSWASNWTLGDGLYWRDAAGIHGMVMSKEPDVGPRGGRKAPGMLMEIRADSMAKLNDALAEAGFGPLDLSEDEIARR